MKTAYFWSIVMAAFVFLSACSSSSKVMSTEEQANFQLLKKKIQNRDYKIDINFAYPTKGRNISLSYGYNLVISGDSAIATLPYFGVAYVAPYGSSDGGIKYNGLMKEYKSTFNESKKKWDIEFKADTRDYNYTFTAEIFSNGSSSVYVTCPQRQPIRFSGNINTSKD